MKMEGAAVRGSRRNQAGGPAHSQVRDAGGAPPGAAGELLEVLGGGIDLEKAPEERTWDGGSNLERGSRGSNLTRGSGLGDQTWEGLRAGESNLGGAPGWGIKPEEGLLGWGIELGEGLRAGGLNLLASSPLSSLERYIVALFVGQTGIVLECGWFGRRGVGAGVILY